MWPETVTVVPLWTASDACASWTAVSAEVPSGNVMTATSPGRMSGVTFSEVSLPQQTPPGWLTSNATSVPDTTALADPMTVPPRLISTVAVSPAWSAKPSTEMKSRSGKTTRLSGNAGTAAVATITPTVAVAASDAPASAAASRATRRRSGRPVPVAVDEDLRMNPPTDVRASAEGSEVLGRETTVPRS
jgi:hypothetical protein